MVRDEKQHPDELSDWRNFKAIKNGGKQALEDRAIAAYILVLDNGGTEQQAQEAHKKVYENYK
jgi:hypothetical protein